MHLHADAFRIHHLIPESSVPSASDAAKALLQHLGCVFIPLRFRPISSDSRPERSLSCVVLSAFAGGAAGATVPLPEDTGREVTQVQRPVIATQEPPVETPPTKEAEEENVPSLVEATREDMLAHGDA